VEHGIKPRCGERQGQLAHSTVTYADDWRYRQSRAPRNRSIMRDVQYGFMVLPRSLDESRKSAELGQPRDARRPRRAAACRPKIQEDVLEMRRVHVGDRLQALGLLNQLAVA
jgi:hypothetical protein